MSEQNSSSGFSFTEFSSGGDMDFDAIFGGASGGPGDVRSCIHKRLSPW